MAFESRRRSVMTETEIRVAPREDDPVLRNEPDPDPLIEEMVQRLRDGLASLTAFDEWGRPLAWRNVVRLAVGPLSGRLRDAETAASIAVNLLPGQEPAVEAPVVELDLEPVLELVVEVVPDEESEAPVEAVAPAVPYGSTGLVSRPYEDVALEPAPEAVAPADVAHAPAPEAPAQEPGEVSGPQAPTAPVGGPSAVPPVMSAPAATSIVVVSGDQRAVAVSPLGPSELLGGRRADDTTAAKYDRFLTSLYGERQQEQEDGGES